MASSSRAPPNRNNSIPDEELQRRVEETGAPRAQMPRAAKLKVTNPSGFESSSSSSGEAPVPSAPTDFNNDSEVHRYERDLEVKGQSVPLYKLNDAHMHETHHMTDMFMKFMKTDPNEKMESRAREELPRKMEEFIETGKATSFVRAAIVSEWKYHKQIHFKANLYTERKETMQGSSKKTAIKEGTILYVYVALHEGKDQAKMDKIDPAYDSDSSGDQSLFSKGARHAAKGAAGFLTLPSKVSSSASSAVSSLKSPTGSFRSYGSGKSKKKGKGDGSGGFQVKRVGQRQYEDARERYDQPPTSAGLSNPAHSGDERE
ncbi:MAG: hypothetical protein Q9162_004557 [Coniocarpon cinnabarinum]